ncbi:MAG: ATP-binding cassette domain-containing protein [Acidobacteriota bacterium]
MIQADGPSSPRDDVVVALRQVSFGYGRDTILDKVDLTIRQGDYLAVIGPNGGGKSTLLKLILGLETPWRGEIERRFRRRGAIGWVPQFAGFDRSFPLRVKDVVLMGRLHLRPPLRRYSRDDREAVAAVLDRLHLGDLAAAPVSELSGGQLQRTLIARALVGDPELLLLDEPLASIDRHTQRILLDELATLAQRIPVVVVTHDLTIFSNHVHQVACVNRGLHYHSGVLNHAHLESLYGAPVELIAHDVPRRVLAGHDDITEPDDIGEHDDITEPDDITRHAAPGERSSGE